MAQVEKLEGQTKQIKDECYRIAWHMRGGVSAHELLWRYSQDDREILNKIIMEHIETTNKTGMPLI